MLLRRKYKINEIDLDQIPGKNRKRKKKRSTPAVVKDGPSSRIAGSGPKVKTLDPDSYDSHICALCLAPMVPAFPHAMDKPASASLPATTLTSVSLSGEHSSSLVSFPSSSPAFQTSSSSSYKASDFDSAAAAAAAPPKDIGSDGRDYKNADITVVDLSSDTEHSPEGLNHTAPPAAGVTAVDVTDLTVQTSDLPSDIKTSNPPRDSGPKYFQPLVCTECGIHVHLGCVHDSGGSAGLTPLMMAGNPLDDVVTLHYFFYIVSIRNAV
jgi:hypothetical protein